MPVRVDRRCLLRVACHVWVARFGFLFVGWSLLFAHRCLIWVTGCGLCVLIGGCSVLFVVCCLIVGAYFVLFIACCVLFFLFDPCGLM